MNFFTELSKRWDQESPSFFNKIKKFGNWLTGTGIALIGVPAGYNGLIDATGLKVDSIFDLSLLVKIASYMVLAGLITTIVSSTTVKDPDVLKK